MNLLEASLTRIWQHYNGRQFAFVTAWRGGSDPESLQQNQVKFEELKRDVANGGYGYVPLRGIAKEELEPGEPESGRIEVGEDGKKYRIVEEPSLLVVNTPSKPSKRYLGPKSTNDFRNFICDIGKKYDQDSIILVTPNEGTDRIGLKPDVHVEQHYNSIRFNDSIVSPYFSQLKPGKKFSFESVLAYDRPRGTNAWMKGMSRASNGELFELLQKPDDEQIRQIMKFLGG